MEARRRKPAHSQPPPEPGPVWVREAALLDPIQAMRLIGSGTPWVLHWCAGGSTRSDASDADRTFSWLREHARLIDDRENERLLAKALRKHKSPTIVIAEHWVSSTTVGQELIVFIETGPGAATSRTDPYRLPWR